MLDFNGSLDAFPRRPKNLNGLLGREVFVIVKPKDLAVLAFQPKYWIVQE